MSLQSGLVVAMPGDLAVDVRDELDHVVLRLRGCLSLRDVPRVREVTVKSLLGAGSVLIDVSGLRSSETAFVTVFPAALVAAGGWPSARLVLFSANTTLRSMLVSARISETVPLATDLSAARTLLRKRPPQVRRHRDLPMHNAAPAAARMFIRESCGAWSLSQTVREVAELVANELVSNAVDHARSSSRLTVTYTGSAFRISVRDYRATPLPQPRPIDINAPRGRGLHLVTLLSQHWGWSSIQTARPSGPASNSIWRRHRPLLFLWMREMAGGLLILDLEKVRFLGSSGLTCLLQARELVQQSAVSQLHLAGLVTRVVVRVLEITGLLGLFNTYLTLTDALARLDETPLVPSARSESHAATDHTVERKIQDSSVLTAWWCRSVGATWTVELRSVAFDTELDHPMVLAAQWLSEGYSVG